MARNDRRVELRKRAAERSRARKPAPRANPSGVATAAAESSVRITRMTAGVRCGRCNGQRMVRMGRRDVPCPVCAVGA